MLDKIEDALDYCNIHYERLDGTMKREDRAKSMDELKYNKSCEVLLVSLRAGGVGLNLTAAQRVYLMDPYWCAPICLFLSTVLRPLQEPCRRKSSSGSYPPSRAEETSDDHQTHRGKYHRSEVTRSSEEEDSVGKYDSCWYNLQQGRTDATTHGRTQRAFRTVILGLLTYHLLLSPSLPLSFLCRLFIDLLFIHTDGTTPSNFHPSVSYHDVYNAALRRPFCTLDNRIRFKSNKVLFFLSNEATLGSNCLDTESEEKATTIQYKRELDVSHNEV
jgi:hypothetical protein